MGSCRAVILIVAKTFPFFLDLALFRKYSPTFTVQVYNIVLMPLCSHTVMFVFTKYAQHYCEQVHSLAKNNYS